MVGGVFCGTAFARRLCVWTGKGVVVKRYREDVRRAAVFDVKVKKKICDILYQ
jgi:hypothetical protein